MIHVTYKHSTCHPGKIICFTVSIEILLRTVITVAVNMLHRTVNRELLLVLVKELVVTQSAAINNMFSLLGNIGFAADKIIIGKVDKVGIEQDNFCFLRFQLF